MKKQLQGIGLILFAHLLFDFRGVLQEYLLFVFGFAGIPWDIIAIIIGLVGLSMVFAKDKKQG